MLGFLGDVGDPAKLVQDKAGIRPRDDLDEALAHELADAYAVDLAAAFDDTMDSLGPHLTRLPDTP